MLKNVLEDISGKLTQGSVQLQSLLEECLAFWALSSAHLQPFYHCGKNKH